MITSVPDNTLILNVFPEYANSARCVHYGL